MAKISSDDIDIEIKANIKDKDKFKKWNKNMNQPTKSNKGGAFYFLGFIGSFVYWTQAAVGFGAVVTGFLKSLVWPAYIVFNLLQNFYGAVN